MDRLEVAYEQISKRLDSIEQRLGDGFARIDARTDTGFVRVDGEFARVDGAIVRLEQKLDRQFFWVVGLIVVSILLPLSGHLPH